MIVWVIIGIIALGAIIMGVSLHDAFWIMFGAIIAILVTCYIITGFWDWLGEIGEKTRKKRANQQKVEKKHKISPIAIIILIIISLVIAERILELVILNSH